jgi:hypothetical protein
MTVAVRLLNPGDAAWPEALEGSAHDVHHLPGWSVASAPLEPGEPFAVRVDGADGSLLLPFVRRSLDGGRWDAVSPYGYAGPAAPAGIDAHQVATLIDAAAARLRQDGSVSWFLRLHPLLDGWADGHADAVDHGWTVSIDLTQDETTFTAALRKGHRGDLRRGETDGIRVRVGTGDSDLEAFVVLHAGTMATREASDYHRFSPHYFSMLRDGLGEAFVLLLAELDGAVVAGAIFTVAKHSGIVGYHLAASVPRPPRGATKLLIAEARRLGRERGCTRLLLGGGLGSDEDALFAFKAGFSADRHRFRTLRLVLDEAECARRCAAVGADPAVRSGYFPAYRLAPGR